MSDASIAAGCYLIFFGMLAQWFVLPVVDCIDLASVGDEARTAAFSPAGDRLVVGTSRGALLFYSWKP